MAIQTILKERFGSNQHLDLGDIPQSQVTSRMGNHSINENDVFSDDGAFTPTNPGSFAKWRALPKFDQAMHQGNVAIKPAQLGKLKALAKASRHMAKATEEGMEELETIKRSEARVNVANFKYKQTALKSDYRSTKAGVEYAKTAHKYRPKYAHLGQGLAISADNASTEVKMVAEGLFFNG